MRKTLSRAAVLLALAGTLVPGSADATASCTGNPCADVECSPTEASAYADGNEYSHSIATAGGATDRHVAPNGGQTDADMSGGMPVEADAKAKKDWSLKEDHEYCSVKKVAELIGGELRLSDDAQRVQQVATLHGAGDLTVGCVADGRIRATESFLGRIYVGNGGGFVLADPASGQGLALADLALRFDGASLAAAVPVDVTAMAPTNAVVELDFVNDARTLSCSAVLYV